MRPIEEIAILPDVVPPKPHSELPVMGVISSHPVSNLYETGIYALQTYSTIQGLLGEGIHRALNYELLAYPEIIEDLEKEVKNRIIDKAFGTLGDCNISKTDGSVRGSILVSYSGSNPEKDMVIYIVVHSYGRRGEIFISFFISGKNGEDVERTTEEIRGILRNFNDFLKREKEKRSQDTALFISEFYRQNGDFYRDVKSYTRDDILSFLYPELFPVDAEVLSKEFLRSGDSILLLYGPPGSGKSKLARFMGYLNGVALLPYGYIAGNLSFIIGSAARELDVYTGKDAIEDTDLGEFFAFSMRGNSTNLKNLKYPTKLIIFDDFDLMQRRADVSSPDYRNVWSNFISITDGVEKSDLKIIITTNMRDVEIDPALLRPGRLFDKIPFGEVPTDFILKRFPLVIDRLQAEENIEELKIVQEAYMELKEGYSNGSISSKINLADVGRLIDKNIIKNKEGKNRGSYILVNTSGYELGGRKVGF